MIVDNHSGPDIGEEWSVTISTRNTLQDNLMVGDASYKQYLLSRGRGSGRKRKRKISKIGGFLHQKLLRMMRFLIKVKIIQMKTVGNISTMVILGLVDFLV